MVRLKFDTAKLRAIIDSADAAHAAWARVSGKIEDARKDLGRLNVSIRTDETRHLSHQSSRGNYERAAFLCDEIANLQQRAALLRTRWEPLAAIATRCREFAERQGWRDTSTGGLHWLGGA